MFFFTRRTDEAIVIETPRGQLVVRVVGIRGDKVRLGIEAPRDVPVHRGEVQQALDRDFTSLEEFPETSRREGLPQALTIPLSEQQLAWLDDLGTVLAAEDYDDMMDRADRRAQTMHRVIEVVIDELDEEVRRRLASVSPSATPGRAPAKPR